MSWKAVQHFRASKLKTVPQSAAVVW